MPSHAAYTWSIHVKKSSGSEKQLYHSCLYILAVSKYVLNILRKNLNIFLVKLKYTRGLCQILQKTPILVWRKNLHMDQHMCSQSVWSMYLNMLMVGICRCFCRSCQKIFWRPWALDITQNTPIQPIARPMAPTLEYAGKTAPYMQNSCILQMISVH